MSPFLAVFLVSMGASLALTPLARRLSRRWNVFALPGGRRRHSGRVPKLGGLSLFVAFLIGAVLVYRLLPPAGDDARRLLGVLLGGALIFFGGLIDDRWELSPWLQLAIQVAGAAIAMANIVFIEVFTDPLSGDQVWIRFRPLALLVSLLWMVGVVNAVNWLDGLDGLAAGVGTVAALLFAWHSYRLGQDSVAAFPIALAGALVGFLPYNLPPARIFLGAAGAYFLGYNLATLAILSPAKIATALLVLAVPILDGLWRIIDRIRQGRSPFYGDRGHLHFRLLDLGVPAAIIAASYYAISLAFGLVAIFAAGLTKFLILIALGGALLLLLIWLSYRGSFRR